MNDIDLCLATTKQNKAQHVWIIVDSDSFHSK